LCDAESFDGELPPVVGEGVQYDGRVLSGFDHLVEVADRSFADCTGEWTVYPLGFPAS
jgi:hypothetical protein